MKRLLIPAAIVAALAVPATAIAAPSPSKADRGEARAECLQMKRAAATNSNFASLVSRERKATIRNAFTQCVKERSAAARSERVESRNAAVEACRSLHKAPREQRGRPENPSAFGKCVSAAAKARNQEADAEQREQTANPATACRAEQKMSAEQFAATYGTKRNAFGTCVSQKAKAQQDDEQEAPSTA